jgi:hypothetical protein
MLLLAQPSPEAFTAVDTGAVAVGAHLVLAWPAHWEQTDSSSTDTAAAAAACLLHLVAPQTSSRQWSLMQGVVFTPYELSDWS